MSLLVGTHFYPDGIAIQIKVLPIQSQVIIINFCNFNYGLFSVVII